MKIKSILALFLTIIMCFSIMTGCNKKSDEAASTTDEAKPSASNAENIEDIPKEPFNILLVGIDDYNDLGNSDAFLMLSIDEANRKLKITSFNRNTYVYIPGFDNANLSRAYTLGQIDLLVKTVEDNFGVDVNRYAIANLYSFEDMLNAVGGVEMTLSEGEIAYINNMMKANGKAQQIESGAGAVTLSGEQTLCYVRNLSEGDEFLRASRQREFIKALISGLKGASASQLADFATAAIPMLNTDMTAEEKVSIVNKLMTYLSYSVEECSMPSEGSYDVVGGKLDPRIIVNDWNKTKSDLNMFLYGN